MSIKTIVKPRGSGKTTTIIKMMEVFDDLYCIVPSESIKRASYPEHLHNRVFIGNDDYLFRNISSRSNVKRVVLDEGFMYELDKLAELYYKLGSMRIDVTAMGSIKGFEY